MNGTLERAQIMEIIPHRDQMLLLDRVRREGDSAHGELLIRGDEFFLQGHFPGNPIVPGVIQCEILAQSACVLLQDQMLQGKLPMYTGLEKVKFRSPVKPGDLFETRCMIVRSKGPFYFAEGTGYITEDDGSERICITAKFSFAIV